ncbi:MAG: NAD(P)/FAD-dependent oxidoreductase [Gammaproteobacteria bacterium]|nr:NAD(P)/FAD-dependent oxidoreductase [Gammaproteobacteria bacterium]
MTTLSRRKFIRLAGAAGASSVLASLGWGLSGCQKSAKKARVVIVGGGFGGATCAKYIRRWDPSIEVTLIERMTTFSTCPFSNAVIGGIRNLNDITHNYNALRQKYGVNVVHGNVIEVDPVKRRVAMEGGMAHDYDRLVISPGIDFRWDAIEGYDEATSATLPHAWKAGTQTQTLRDQLVSMEDGGTVIIVAPPNPFRCPPGPYERASLIAHYLKENKPKSKILILDAKEKFSKQPLFVQGWEKLYPGMIEWVGSNKGGEIVRVDAQAMTVYDKFDTAHKGNVINIIPPQKAASIAHTMGLVNNDGWAPVNQTTFESTQHKDIHIIGDASIAGKMPKSGFAANSQGKVCAAAVVSAINNKTMPPPSYVNTCYSLVSPDYGISVAAVYNIQNGTISTIEGAGGVSPADADDVFRKKEAEYAVGWYQSITSDIFS